MAIKEKKKTKSLLTTANPTPLSAFFIFCNFPLMPFGDGRKLQKMKKAERGVGLAVVNRDLVFFFSFNAIWPWKKLQKMKKTERSVGLAVVNRDLVLFFSFNAIWPWKKITKDEKG